MGRTTQGTELRIRTRRPCSECAPPMKRPAETNSQQQTHRNRTPRQELLWPLRFGGWRCLSSVSALLLTSSVVSGN